MNTKSKIVCTILHNQGSEKAVKVRAAAYRGNNATDVEFFLPKSQIEVGKISGRGTPEFNASVYTDTIELPTWLFDKKQRELRVELHDVSEAAKARRLAVIRG